MSRLRDQSGLALPVVMGALLLMLVVLATASTRATIGLGTSSNDVASKRALQAAKSGLRTAMARASSVGLDLNQLLTTNREQRCLVLSNGGLTVQTLSGGNWCPEVGEDLGTGSDYAYRMRRVDISPTPGGWTLLTLGWKNYTLTRRIVSSGTVDGVTRRVTATATAQGRLFIVQLLFIAVIGNGDLESYKLQAGSLRECTPEPTDVNDPESGC